MTNDELIDMLSKALTYVEGAYECAFPDQDENDYVAESVRRAIAELSTRPQPNSDTPPQLNKGSVLSCKEVLEQMLIETKKKEADDDVKEHWHRYAYQSNIKAIEIVIAMLEEGQAL